MQQKLCLFMVLELGHMRCLPSCPMLGLQVRGLLVLQGCAKHWPMKVHIFFAVWAKDVIAKHSQPLPV